MVISDYYLGMESLELTESEVEACKSFLQRFCTSYAEDQDKCSADNSDKFDTFCFCLTSDEINGEIIDVLHRFLYLK